MRYLVWFSLPLCAALLIGCLFPVLWLCWVSAALLLAAAIFARFRNQSRWHIQLLLILMGSAAGFLWFEGYHLLVVRPAENLNGLSDTCSAEVLTFPEETDYGITIDVKFCSGLADGKKARLFLDDKYDTLKPGDLLTGTAEFTSALDRTHSSSYTADGIFLAASVEIESIKAADSVPFRYFPAWLGHKLKEQIKLFYSEEEGALLRGLLTGDKSYIGEHLYTCFRRSGTAHLLAVSGLHVGFLSGLIYLLPGNRKRRVFIAVPIMVCFAIMTGGQSSVWRAVIMGSMLLIAPLFRRETDSLTSLALALLLLLAANPYASCSIGLQLSFAAVAGLVCFGGRLYQWMTIPLQSNKRSSNTPIQRFIKNAYRVIAGGISTSCAALVFTLPLTALYFETISLIGPVSNLLVVWAASLAFGLGIVGCSIGAIYPPIGTLFALINRWLLRWMIGSVKALGNLPFSSVRLDNLYLKVWLFLLISVILFIIFIPEIRLHPILPIVSTASLLLIALSLRILSLCTVPFCISTLDVGQGSCTVFSSDGVYIAVDCGGTESGDILADYLQSGGAPKLAALVITHYDADHMNGAEELFSRMSVDLLILPDVDDESGNRELLEKMADDYGCALETISEDTLCLSFGNAKMTVFPPVDSSSDNSSCLSALCTWENRNVLVTGDLPMKEEEILLNRFSLPELDILVVGHHGSRTSTGDYLLEELSPKSAVISVGENHYNLPSGETLRRLAENQCEIYRTDLNGTITFRFH